MRYALPAELHCHSNSKEKGLRFSPYVSDSLQTAQEIVDECLRKSIKVLAITDHDSLLGYHLAKSYIKKNKIDILLIPACEISTTKGHILAYGITREIPEKLSPKETVDLIHLQGGLAFPAHPFTPPYMSGMSIFKLPIDGVEGYNGPTPSIFNDFSAYQARKHALPFIAGSDSHEKWSIGSGKVFFPKTVTTVKKALDCLKIGEFSLSFNNSSHGMSILAHTLDFIDNLLHDYKPHENPVPNLSEAESTGVEPVRDCSH